MGALSPSHWMVVILVGLIILLVFNGSKKIPELARGLGRGIRIFKSEFNELEQDKVKNKTESNQTELPAESTKEVSPPAQSPNDNVH